MVTPGEGVTAGVVTTGKGVAVTPLVGEGVTVGMVTPGEGVTAGVVTTGKGVAVAPVVGEGVTGGVLTGLE